MTPETSPLLYVAAGVILVAILMEIAPRIGGALLIVLTLGALVAYERRGKVYVTA